MIGRTLARTSNTPQNSEPLLNASWLYSPFWSAIVGAPSPCTTSAAFYHVHRTFHNGPLTMAEFCFGSSNCTSRILRKLIEQLRLTSDREVVILPTYPPESDYELEDRHYGSLKNTYVSVLPSTVWKQIYPSESLNFALSRNSFLSLSEAPAATDTIWSALTEEPAAQNQAAATAAADLNLLLRLRRKELKKDAIFVLDVPMEHPVPEASPLRLLNSVYQDFVQCGVISQAEAHRTNLGFYKRTPAMLDSALQQHKSYYKVVSKEVKISRHSAWERFSEHGDLETFTNEGLQLLRQWTRPGILSGLSERRSPEEKERILSDIYEEVSRLIAEKPVPLEFKTCNCILKRIN